MAMVNMKCSSCGATLRAADGCLVCDYCGSVYFRLEKSDPHESEGTTSLQDFLASIDENYDTYCINCAKGVISGADADLVNNKIKAAGKALSDGEFYKVDDYLKGVPSDLFAAARLRLLSSACARSEAELSYYAGDIAKLPDYPDLVAACDEDAKAVYDRIKEICLNNARLAAKIAEGNELIRIERYDEALGYAEKLVKAHPFSSRARALLIKARCAAVRDYDPTDDLALLKACPDAALTFNASDADVYGVPVNLDPYVKDYCRAFYRRRNAKKGFFFKYLLKPLLVIIAIGLLIGVWQLIDALVS